MTRPCLDCGVPQSNGSRCVAHAKARKAARNADAPRARAAVAEWVAAHGWWCPGWQREAHPSNDLTADHVVAMARGGGGGALAVLCRPCNSAKGAR